MEDDREPTRGSARPTRHSHADTGDSRDRGMTMKDEAWVHDLLSSVPTPPAPGYVVDAVTAALAAEQASRSRPRSQGDPLADLVEQCTMGTFEANVPSHYTKKGLGIQSRHEVG